METLYQFIGIIRAINGTWLKGFIFCLCLSIKIMTINYKHYLIHVIQF